MKRHDGVMKKARKGVCEGGN